MKKIDVVEVTWVKDPEMKHTPPHAKKQKEKSSLWKFKILTITIIKINQSCTTWNNNTNTRIDV